MPVIVEKQGAPKPPSANTPPDCDKCQYFEGTIRNNANWDSARDATQAYQLLRAQMYTNLWNALWANFRCPPPGKACNQKKSCSPRFTYLLGWIDVRVDPADGNVRWYCAMTLGREIMCVKEGGGTDDPPTVPPFAPPTPETPPTPPAPKPSKDEFAASPLETRGIHVTYSAPVESTRKRPK